MPHTARNEDCIAWALDELFEVQLLFAVFLLDFGEDLDEIVDGFVFVVFRPELFALDDCFGHVGTECHPALVALKGGVPSRRLERISMHGRPRSLWPNNQPTITTFSTTDKAVVSSHPPT